MTQQQDTKGVRQVLDKLADLLICDEHVPEYWTVYLENADQELQEIMLGMLPDPYMKGSGVPSYNYPGYSQAIKDMEQNIRGGFNNG